MKLKELINKSTYCSTGHISCEEDIDKLEQYVLHNLPILNEFKEIYFINNYTQYAEDSLFIITERMQREYGKIYQNGISKGHSFGAAENDNISIALAKTDWVCKSAHDIILQPEILEKEIGEADFYYLNGIGYGGMEKYNFDNERIINEDFYPQTNFYFINKDKIDYLNDWNYIQETYKQLINTPGFNGKPWEYIPNWSCESFLRQCVERNKLSKEHLISQDSYIKLIEIVKQFQIHDNSYKNIMTEGICHFHNQNDQIIEI